METPGKMDSVALFKKDPAEFLANHIPTFSPAAAKVALKQLLAARLTGPDIVLALSALWDQLSVKDPELVPVLMKQYARSAKELPNRATMINFISWKVGYEAFSPESPPHVMHFMADNIPKTYAGDARVLGFICQCISSSALDNQNRLALLMLIARTAKISKIWEEHVVPCVLALNVEKYVDKIAKVLIADQFPVPLMQLLEKFPEKLFTASISLPVACDDSIQLPARYEAMRHFARTFTMTKRETFTKCSLHTYEKLLDAVIDSASRETLPLETALALMNSIESIGMARMSEGQLGCIESILACFRVVETTSDPAEILNEHDNIMALLRRKFKTCALRIQKEWRDPAYVDKRTRMSMNSIITAINVFARLQLDGPFESLALLLQLPDFVSEFPRSVVGRITANCIRFVNTFDSVRLWRLACVDAVIPLLPVLDENTQKLIGVMCRIRLIKGAWQPELPAAETSWSRIGNRQHKLSNSDKTNDAYLRCFEASLGEANERATAALYSYLLGRDKSLIWPAANFVSTDSSRRELLAYIDKVADEIPANRLALARILCGSPIPNPFPLNKLAKEDVLIVSYQLEYQGRLRDAGFLARVDANDISQQYRVVALRRDRRLFANLERQSHPKTFDIAFWRTQAKEVFDIPTSANEFWDLVVSPGQKCQALLYLAKRPDTNGPGALAAALECFDILSKCKEGIPPWLFTIMRKKSLDIIADKYVAHGLVDWAVRYGWKDKEESSDPIVVEEETDMDITEKELELAIHDICDYMTGRKTSIDNDVFGVLDLEQLLGKGHAKAVEVSARKCLRRLWNGYESLSCSVQMKAMHPAMSFICSIIAPYCAFVAIGLIYQVRRVQNILKGQWPSAACIRAPLVKTVTAQNTSPLVLNQGVFKTCTAFLHCEATLCGDLLFATRVFAATEDTEQMCRSWCVKLPRRTIGSFIDRLYAILATNEKTAKEASQAESNDTDEVRHKFWADRKKNDALVESLLHEITVTCPWLTWIMTGVPARGWSHALALAGNDPILAMLICGNPTAEDLQGLTDNLQYEFNTDAVFGAAREWRAWKNKHEKQSRYRELVTLFLDEDLCRLPLESLPGVETTPFTREIHNRLPVSGPGQSAPDGTGYYVLNPDGTLPHQEELLRLCKNLQWNGRHLEAPPASEVYAKLSSSRAFLYAGHNGGERLVNMDEIQRGGDTTWNSAVLLMGCHTACTEKMEKRPAFNACFHYLIGGCPFVVGNLWGVLSNDCDTMCKSVLKLWKLSNPKGGVTPHLAVALAMSRRAPKFRYLTAASAVCFGSDELGRAAIESGMREIARVHKAKYTATTPIQVSD